MPRPVNPWKKVRARKRAIEAKKSNDTVVVLDVDMEHPTTRPYIHTKVTGLLLSGSLSFPMKLVKQRYRKLAKTVRVQANINGQTLVFHIPKGFEWNGASIPKVFQALIGDPMDVQFLLASLVHDYLYHIGCDRDIADQLFYMLLRKENGKFDIPAWKEQAMYAAVRVGGQAFYATRRMPDWTLRPLDRLGYECWSLVKSLL